jgi:hypothetical protein
MKKDKRADRVNRQQEELITAYRLAKKGAKAAATAKGMPVFWSGPFLRISAESAYSAFLSAAKKIYVPS